MMLNRAAPIAAGAGIPAPSEGRWEEAWLASDTSTQNTALSSAASHDGATAQATARNASRRVPQRVTRTWSRSPESASRRPIAAPHIAAPGGKRSAAPTAPVSSQRTGTAGPAPE